MLPLLGSAEDALRRHACYGPVKVEVPLAIRPAPPLAAQQPSVDSSIAASTARASASAARTTGAAFAAHDQPAVLAACPAPSIGSMASAPAEACSMWLFRPSAVAADADVRANAKEACLRAAATLRVGASSGNISTSGVVLALR